MWQVREQNKAVLYRHCLKIFSICRKESNEPSESAEPESKPSEDVSEPKEDVRIINKSNESAVDSTWSTVESSSNTTDNGALTLYTSAQKDGDEFIWDDSQKWVLKYRTATADIIHCLTKM